MVLYNVHAACGPTLAAILRACLSRKATLTVIGIVNFIAQMLICLAVVLPFHHWNALALQAGFILSGLGAELTCMAMATEIVDFTVDQRTTRPKKYIAGLLYNRQAFIDANISGAPLLAPLGTKVLIRVLSALSALALAAIVSLICWIGDERPVQALEQEQEQEQEHSAPTTWSAYQKDVKQSLSKAITMAMVVCFALPITQSNTLVSRRKIQASTLERDSK